MYAAVRKAVAEIVTGTYSPLRKQTMFDKEALITLQESKAIEAAQKALAFAHQDSNDLAALPSDFTMHDLEKFLPLRRRARGTMATAIVDSFCDYTKQHAEPGATVFVDADNMQAFAVLNLGTPDEPGHADNKARVTIKRTAAYQAMLNIAGGQGQKQATVAEFLEDWPDQIGCFNDAGLISTPKAIAAIRKLTIESMRKLESSEQQLSASKSAFESVQATSVDPIPTTAIFRCQPYPELMERAFALRLSIQTGNDKPTISMRVIKIEEHQEQMAKELAELIAQGFDGEAIPVLIGGYSKTE